MVAIKVPENFWKTDKISLEARFCKNQTRKTVRVCLVSFGPLHLMNSIHCYSVSHRKLSIAMPKLIEQTSPLFSVHSESVKFLWPLPGPLSDHVLINRVRLLEGPYTALDRPRVNRSNRKIQSYYTIISVRI